MSEDKDKDKDIMSFIFLIPLLTICMMLIVGIPFFLSNKGLDVSRKDLTEETATQFYKSYLIDMGDYGLSDIEKLTKNYFSKDLLNRTNLEGAKDDLNKMKNMKVKFKGNIISADDFGNEVYLNVNEWLEIDGKKVDSSFLTGTYIVIKEDGLLKFFNIAGSSSENSSKKQNDKDK